MPLEIHEVPSGTEVFDWTIPREWNIRDAYVKDAEGRRVIDFAESNLHVVNYSAPVSARMTLEELRGRLTSIPERPDWIPYRTSYYKEDWGFCLSHDALLALEDGEYEVCIDSTLEDGSLSYGEVFLAGESADEVLISTHACHPSLCNDNLSGVAVATFLARTIAVAAEAALLPVPLHSRHDRRDHLAAREPGDASTGSSTASCLPASATAARSRTSARDAATPRSTVRSSTCSATRATTTTVVDFSPYGYDERQYCSPGFDLPVGTFMRTPPGRFPEYHTSADDLDLVDAASLADSLRKLTAVLSVLDGDGTYVNRNPMCEPQLGKRGLYSLVGGRKDESLSELALLWVLNLSDSTPHAARHRRALGPRVRGDPGRGGRAHRVRSPAGGRMRVVVTGSEGYIGSVLCPYLVERGHEVVGVDAGLYRSPLLYEDADTSVETRRRDIRRLEPADMDGADAVVHMAELSNDPVGQLAPEVTYDINHRGSLHVAETARAARVPRFVYTSSCSVYGASDQELVDEESPLSPQTAYAKCKELVERDVATMAGDTFSPTFLRNATACGASPRIRFDVVLNNLLRPCLDDEGHPDGERRLPVAPDRPRPRHLRGDCVHARRAARPRPQRGAERR